MPAESHLASLEVFRREVIAPAAITDRAPLDAAAFQCPEPVAFDTARRARFKPVRAGWHWGPAWSTCWFRLRGRVPSSRRGLPLHLHFNSGTEALLWAGPGDPAHGFDANRHLAPLAARPGHPLELFVEAACNHPLGVAPLPWGHADLAPRWNSPTPGHFTAAELVVVDPALQRLDRAWAFAIALARELLPPPPPITTHSDLFPANLPWQNPRCEGLLSALRAAHRLIDPHDPRRGAAAALRVLESALRSPPAGSTTLCHALGHAHIDTAWLWPLRETRRKCLRTFSNVLSLMARHPGFRFIASQAAQYAMVEADAPALFRRIARRVASGQWEPAGAMWVEPDCNIPSGESLVRQVLHGCAYWADRFGPRTPQRVLFLPDTFGFPPCLPTIMRGCGLDTFITSKIAWNDTTPFPHTTFSWRGLDGSEVLSHFTPGNDYNATNSPRELRRGQANHRTLQIPARDDRGRAFAGARWLQPFGFGDGGGGPTDAMIDHAQWSAECEGLPRVRMTTAHDFARALHHDVLAARRAGTATPVWSGELYLERHRGTLTSQAAVKRANREAEDRLRLAELLLAGSPTPVPRAALARAARRLDEAWKLVLLNQFHDILPGSSVAPVYADARADHARALAIADDLIADGLARWAGALGGGGRASPVMIVNPVSARTVADAALPSGRRVVCAPALGARVVEGRPTGRSGTDASPGGPGVTVTASSDARTAVLANDHLLARIDHLGRVTSLRVLDEEGSPGPELVAPDAAMLDLVLHEDRPRAWDAWDIDDTHAWKPLPQTAPATRWRVSARGGERGCIEITRPIGQRSTCRLSIALARGMRRLAIHARIDWRERRQLLRAEFPTSIRAERASFQTQFGRHTRPVHANTPAEAAAFEVPVRRWIDASDARHGVALLNTSTFGGSARAGPNGTCVIALSLLRSPTYPDPDADQGAHDVHLALLPHEGPLAWANVDEEAEAMHRPLLAFPLPVRSARRAGPTEWAPVEIESDTPAYVEVTALKPAHDGRGVILRLAETAGAGTDVVIRWNIPARRVTAADLLERDPRSPGAGQSISGVRHDPRRRTTRLALHPFQIATLRAE